MLFHTVDNPIQSQTRHLAHISPTLGVTVWLVHTEYTDGVNTSAFSWSCNCGIESTEPYIDVIRSVPYADALAHRFSNNCGIAPLPEPCSRCGHQYPEEKLRLARRGEMRLDDNPTHLCVPPPPGKHRKRRLREYADMPFEFDLDRTPAATR